MKGQYYIIMFVLTFDVLIMEKLRSNEPKNRSTSEKQTWQIKAYIQNQFRCIITLYTVGNNVSKDDTPDAKFAKLEFPLSEQVIIMHMLQVL